MAFFVTLCTFYNGPKDYLVLLLFVKGMRFRLIYYLSRKQQVYSNFYDRLINKL